MSPARARALAAALDSLLVRAAPLDSEVSIAVVLTADTLHPTPLILSGPVYFLPDATDGRTCLVLVPLDRRAPPERHERRLLGPCAFYAMFGRPGRGVSHWLQTTAHLPAAELSLAAPVTAAGPDAEDAVAMGVVNFLIGASRQSLPLQASGCAAGRLEQCRSLLDLGPSFGRPLPRTMAQKFLWANPSESSYLLSNLLFDQGRERFARFWRSPEPRDSAFAHAMGVSFETWTYRWLAAHHADVRVGPAIRPVSVLFGLLLAVLLVSGGAYYSTRRQVG